MLTLAQATLSVKSFVKVADVRIVLPHARNEIAIFSSSVRIEPVPIREIEGLRSSRSCRDITEADDGSAIHIRSQPLPPWLLFISGSLDTNAATSCETQLPFWRRRHPRRIVATLPRERKRRCSSSNRLGLSASATAISTCVRGAASHSQGHATR